MAKKKDKKLTRKKAVSIICFILILVLICVLYYFYSPQINNFIDAWRNQGNLSATQSSTNSGEATELSSEPIIVSGTKSRDLSVHVVDVGQGDAIIVQFPEGSNMLIDAGDGKSANDTKLTNYIDSLNITTFDYLVATHQDADHVGGMDVVFEKYLIKHVFRPYVLCEYVASATEDLPDYDNLPQGFNCGLQKNDGGNVSTSKTYYSFLTYIIDEASTWSFFNKDNDIKFDLDGDNSTFECVFDFLTPTKEVFKIAYKDANDYSPIVLLKYAGVSVMLTGDAEAEAEAEFLEYYKDVTMDIDVLKVGHHGSRTSTSQGLLDKTSPEVALISANFVGNKFYHPRQETLDRLVAEGSAIYRTDLQGDLSFSINQTTKLSSITTSKICNDDTLIRTAPELPPSATAGNSLLNLVENTYF